MRGMKGLIKKRTAVISAGIILLMVLLAVFVPVLSPYDPYSQDLTNRLAAPGGGHIFGTDELGRDLLTRLFTGARVSLVVATVPTALAVLVGTLLGIGGACFGRAADAVTGWVSNVTLSFPGMLFAMIIMYTFGGSMSSVMIAIVAMECGSIARIVRSATLSIMENDYILAARSMGVGKAAIIIRHIVPNLMPTLIVLFTLNIPASILSESALSFLGIGIQPPGVSLGLMVSGSQSCIFNMPHLALIPSLVIMILVLAFNYLGDAVRDVLDPKAG